MTDSASRELEAILARIYEAEAAGETVDIDALCQGDINLIREVEAARALSPGIDEAFASLRSNLRPDSPGSNIGDYRLDAPLGEGGMGRVFRATHVETGEVVALKVQRVHDDVTRLRLLREAEITAAIDHPNIVGVRGVGEEDGLAWVAMELLDGPTFGDWARSRGPRDIALAGAAIARALHAAHLQGVVHRDVKPNNILMRGNIPCVLDFGLAKTANTDALTREGIALGTMPYMAPEQLTGERRLMDARTDVYGLGATLYDVLAGHPPFAGDSGDRLVRDILTSDPPTLPLAVDYRDLDTVIARALAKEPDRRYTSAELLAMDLERFHAGDRVHARRSGPTSRAWRRIQRHPRTAIGIAALALIALISAWNWASESNRLARQLGDDVARVEESIEDRRLADAEAGIADLRTHFAGAAELTALAKRLEARQSLERLLNGVHLNAHSTTARLERLDAKVVDSEAGRYWPEEVRVARVLLALQSGNHARANALLESVRGESKLPLTTALVRAHLNGGSLEDALAVTPGGVDDSVGACTVLRLAKAPYELQERHSMEARLRHKDHYRLSFEAARIRTDHGNHEAALEVWMGLRRAGHRADVIDRELAREFEALGEYHLADRIMSTLIRNGTPANANDAATWIEIARRRKDGIEAWRRLERSRGVKDTDGTITFMEAKLELDAIRGDLDRSPGAHLGDGREHTISLLERLIEEGTTPFRERFARSILLELRLKDLYSDPAIVSGSEPPPNLAAELRHMDEQAEKLIEVTDPRERCAPLLQRANIARALLQESRVIEFATAAIEADPTHPGSYQLLLSATIATYTEDRFAQAESALALTRTFLRSDVPGRWDTSSGDRVKTYAFAVQLCEVMGDPERKRQLAAEGARFATRAQVDEDPDGYLAYVRAEAGG